MLRFLPNVLTVFRLILIIPFLLLLLQKEYKDAFYVFCLAGVTDALDGWLARNFKWQSPFGSFMDPLADKLLVSSSFISLALLGSLPWWLVILVFLRDLTISLGVVAWFCFVRNQLEFEPTQLSKLNTSLQIILVTICLFELAFFPFIPYLKEVLIGMTLTTTIGSYIDYVWTWSKKACSRNQLAK